MVKKTAGGLQSSAFLSVRQQKATYRAGGPARRKNLCQKCTLEHPQTGAERSNLPANRSQYLVRMASIKDQDPVRQSRRQSRPRRGRSGAGLRYYRCGLSGCIPTAFLVYLVPWESAHFRIGNRTVFPGNPQADAISDRPAAGGSGLFLNRLLRCRLNLAADISAGNLDPDLVRNLDCQR